MPVHRIPAHRARLPFGMLVLLLAVIGWGLEYKISLYRAIYLHSPSPLPAKLLSEAERKLASKRTAPALLESIRRMAAGTLSAVTAEYRDAALCIECCSIRASQDPRQERWIVRHLSLRAPPLS